MFCKRDGRKLSVHNSGNELRDVLATKILPHIWFLLGCESDE